MTNPFDEDEVSSFDSTDLTRLTPANNGTYELTVDSDGTITLTKVDFKRSSWNWPTFKNIKEATPTASPQNSHDAEIKNKGNDIKMKGMIAYALKNWKSVLSGKDTMIPLPDNNRDDLISKLDSLKANLTKYLEFFKESIKKNKCLTGFGMFTPNITCSNFKDKNGNDINLTVLGKSDIKQTITNILLSSTYDKITPDLYIRLTSSQQLLLLYYLTIFVSTKTGGRTKRKKNKKRIYV